jgi:CheY-like chemotaxis protein
VLLVDASEALDEALRMMLSEFGCSIDTVIGMDAAWQAIDQAQQKNKPYQLVFINEPIRRSFEDGLILRIRADERLANLRVAVIATLSQRGARDSWLQPLPNTEWLTKPVTQSGMIATLEKFYPRESGEVHARIAQSALEESIRKILLVEDNKVNQMVARGMLNKLGYQVTTAANGVEALSLLDDFHYDAILMDCMMPEMDGYEATHCIREREKASGQPRVPIIAMTANVIEGEEARCLAIGMDDYLAKPVNKEQLEIKLLQWLGQGADNPQAQSS